MKKIIALLLTVLMMAGSLTVFASAMSEDNFELSQTFNNEETYKLGDVDGDGSVNARDSYLIKADIAKIGNEEIITDAADIFADGEITAKDNFCLKTCFAEVADIRNYENGCQVYSFTIGGIPVSDFVIVLPEGTTYESNLYYCYELLWKYVEKATGVKIPLVYGETDASHAIYFHEESLKSEPGQELGYDGYMYKVENGSIYFYGAKRGNMYAVYEILEDYLGFFFCDNASTYSVKKRTVDIPEGLSRKYIPSFSYRHVSHTFWGSSFRNYYIARRLDATNNSPYSGSATYGTYKGTRFNNAHSFYYFIAMGAGKMPEEGTLNPEGTVMTLADRYYNKYTDGVAHAYERGLISNTDMVTEHGHQPCASSTDDYNLLFSGLLDTMRMIEARGYDMLFGENGQHVMSFSINDGDLYCTCTLCAAKATGAKNKKLRGSMKTELENYGGDYTLSEDGNYASFKKEGYAGVYLDLANRAAKDIQEYYPGARLYQIIYSEEIPESVRPSKNMVMCYCADITGCVYHRYGDSAECKGYHTQWDNIHPASADEESIKSWVKFCHGAGTELWYWMYPENYTYYLFDLPVYYTIFYNTKWLNENGVDGIYYEGTGDGGAENCFEHVKAFMASELFWNPQMTLSEYEELTKRYMKAYYGAGYEHVFNLLRMMEDAGRATNFCCTYYCPAFDVYDKKYFDAHYEEMRAEAVAAVDMSNPNTKGLCEKLLMTCDFLGLSAAHDRMYTNGTSETKKTYEERYNWLYNYMRDHIGKYTYAGVGADWGLPKTIDYTVSPILQVYTAEFRSIAH